MSETAVYISENSFKIEDKDVTDTYVITARVMVNCSGEWKYTSIISSSYDGSDTTITLFSSVLTDPCGECDIANVISGPTGNLPRHDHSTEHTGGLGVKGSPPDHIWSGTYISFEQNDGSYGPYVDLQGDSFNPTGDWALSTSYSPLDIVDNDGSSYICTTAHTSSSTDEPGTGVYWEDYWTLSASKGDDGADGATGATGATGASDYQGEWDELIDYEVNDTVMNDFALFICTQAHTSAYDTNEPKFGSVWNEYWDICAVGFYYYGDWIESESFFTYDLVSNNGSLYSCKGVHTSDATTEPGVGAYWETYWNLAVEKGDKGDTGNTGAQGNSFVWESNWVTATGYTERDTVENDGSSYICTSDHTSDATSEPGVGAYWSDYWDLMAQKGDDGAAGATGTIWDWQGYWTTSTTYYVDDGVGNDNASYICTVEHTSDATTEPGTGAYWEDYWDLVVEANTTGPQVRSIVEGRIDLSSATELIWSSILGFGISIYNGSNWELITPSSAPTLANTDNDLDSNPLAVDTVYNLFAEYDTSTNFNIVAKICSGTYGVDACYQHEGVYVDENTVAGLKRRFLGTIYTYNNGGTVNFKDEENYRYISNFYNRQFKLLVTQNNTSGSWTYSNTIIRESNNGTNQIRGQFVSCMIQSRLAKGKWLITSSVSGAAMTGCGFNSTSALTGSWAWLHSSNTQVQVPMLSKLSIEPGYNYITTVEKSDSSTATFESSSGTQGALFLELEC